MVVDFIGCFIDDAFCYVSYLNFMNLVVVNCLWYLLKYLFVWCIGVICWNCIGNVLEMCLQMTLYFGRLREWGVAEFYELCVGCWGIDVSPLWRGARGKLLKSVKWGWGWSNVKLSVFFTFNFFGVYRTNVLKYRLPVFWDMIFYLICRIRLANIEY